MRTGIILHKPGHIVYLQTQRMTNTVRHKRPGEIIFHHRLFTHVGNDLMLTQQLCDALMELNMIIHIANARLHGSDQRQLFVVNIFHQVGVVVIAFRRPGPRQIRRVAVVFRARIQQETAHFRRCLMIQFRVMQHGGMFVQRHNVAVRNIGIAMSRGGQVRQVDVKLAHAGTEGLFRRPMTAHRHFLRFAHTGQFIIRFIGAVVMQIVDNTFRVDVAGGDIQL
ncbi:Uncharacterised protein [Salmonella enterica subsp. enterica serovar Typhi]|nr:Uncharacterised protein [Salmonella enterica subsp. enterica serovar Typhi]